MGLFDGIGDLFSKGANTLFGSQGTSPAEQAQAGLVQQDLNAANANIDNSQNVQNQLVDRAQGYRSNIAGTEDNAAGMLGERSRQDFSNKLTGNNQRASSRGLLYSGIKQGADQQAASDYATSLAAGRNKANNAVNEQANQMDKAAIGNGMDVYNQRESLNNIQYQDMLNRRQNDAAQVNSVASGIGAVGGLLFPAKKGM